MNARLLAVSWEMPPLSGPRAIQVSRLLAALAQRGWPSRVIAVEPRIDGPLLRDTAGAPAFAANGVSISRVPSPQEGFAYRAAMRVLPGAAHRPDRQRGWLPSAVREAERWLAIERHERLVTFAQPWTDHLVGLQLHREHGLPWVAHFSDPWVDSPYRSTHLGAMPFAVRAEHDVIREASAIVFVTEQTADVVMAKYPKSWRRKVHVIPHGYERRSVEHIQRRRARSRRMRIVYTGRFYAGLRSPEAFVAALAQVAATRVLRDELEVLLIGPGMDRYRTLVQASGMEGVVHLQPQVAYEQALQAAADADVLLVLDADAPGASMFLPSKVVDYLLWRTPILGLTPRDGATAALLTRLGFATAAPGDVGAIARAVATLLDNWRDGTLGVSSDFDRVADEYDIERTATQFAHVLNNLLTGTVPLQGDRSR